MTIKERVYKAAREDIDRQISQLIAIPDLFICPLPPVHGARQMLEQKDWRLELAASGALGCRFHTICPQNAEALWPLPTWIR